MIGHMRFAVLAICMSLAALAGACDAPPDTGSPDAGPRSWGSPVSIEADDVGDALVSPLAVASNHRGDTAIAWTQSDRVRYSIWAKIWSSAADAWQPTLLLEQDHDAEMRAPLVGVDSTGGVVATWGSSFDEDKYTYTVWSNRFDPTVGRWGDPHPLSDPDDGSAHPVGLAVDPAGSAFVLAANGADLTVTRLRADTGEWTAPELLSRNVSAGSAAIGVDDAGNAWVAWIEGLRFSPRTSRYDAATDRWSEPAGVAGTETILWDHVALAVPDSGEVALLLSERSADPSSEPKQLVSVSYDPNSSSWSAPQLNHLFAYIGEEQLVASPNGDLFAIWTEYDVGGQIWSAHKPAGASEWEDPLRLETPARAPHIDVDDHGRAIATWASGTADYALRSAVWTPQTAAWSAPIEVVGGPMERAALAVAGNGEATAAWLQDDGTVIDVWARRYDD